MNGALRDGSLTRARGHYQGYITPTSRAEKCIFLQGRQVIEYLNFRAALHFCACVHYKKTNMLLKAHKHGLLFIYCKYIFKKVSKLSYLFHSFRQININACLQYP